MVMGCLVNEPNLELKSCGWYDRDARVLDVSTHYLSVDAHSLTPGELGADVLHCGAELHGIDSSGVRCVCSHIPTSRDIGTFEQDYLQ
jgi:hypothetical protein